MDRPTPFTAVNAPNVSAAAAAQIRELIARDVLRPDDPLPGERDLAEQTEISRTSIRGALQMLVTEGLLISKRGAGLRVAAELGKTVKDPVLKLLETVSDTTVHYLAYRRTIESECARLAALNASPAERTEIHEAQSAFLEALEVGDPERAAAADVDFHMAIIAAAGNVVMIQLARSLYDLMERQIETSHQVVFDGAEAWRALVPQHAAIDDAISARDAEGAQSAMHAHLSYLIELSEQRQQDRTRDSFARMRAARR